jgi:hypothetical protein
LTEKKRQEGHEKVGAMELFGDGLQLVGFLAVTVSILASLVAIAIGITVFLYMADRRIEIDKRERWPSRIQHSG